ncbi:condensation domain-containing protein [Candidatus Odyssella acanthamoebae]|uniref:condensation domain-containing protein n=1 Tax=Candidatus Odyssella acanthamoebae TaxID=91604 RepID=UPI00068EE90F|nr:condensation domain-containing protein [Candidatus Paracaedibacter acanthamoebae]
MTETVQLLPSLGQERLLFLQELTPNDTAYNIGIALSFEGPLDKRALFYACKTLMRYHDSLRMTFSQLDGKPIATISPDVNIDINQIDCSKVSIGKGLKEIYEKFFKQEISKVFNLEKGPLIRHTLLCFNPNLHILIMSCHHIIFDGWSMMVYLKELAANYQALIRHQSLSLTPVTHFYRDFIVEQRARMQGVVQEELLEYWKHQLAYLEPLILPTDKPRTRESPNIKKYDFNFSTEFSQTLRQLSQEKGVTLYTILFSAFCSFLFRHSGQEDFSIGVPMHGRNKGNLEDVIGFFINTLPIRVNLASNKRFATLVEEVKVTMRGALMHQEVPLSHLITELKLSRDINRDPLFPVMFTMENFQPPSLDFNNLNVKMVGIEAGGIPCAISLEVHTYLEDFLGVFKYDANLFKKSTIHRMVGHWLELLKGISQNYDQAISQLPLLTALERKQLLIDWNKTEKNTPKTKRFISCLKSKS